MGCRLSSAEGDETAKAGSLTDVNEIMADALPDPAPPAPTDPRLPLDARQVFKLKKSWKGIKRCMADTGVEMFIRVGTEDEIRVSELVEKHAISVMGTLDELISNIDNVDYVFDVLKATGQSHMKFPGFRTELIWDMEKPFLEAVKITLGDRYSDNMDTIYRITIKFILDSVIKSSTAPTNNSVS
uniref:Globin domain-containing protein n=1 Tax=Magallana gigas TaxID=29159 RepID=K1RDY1_MAGGI